MAFFYWGYMGHPILTDDHERFSVKGPLPVISNNPNRCCNPNCNDIGALPFTSNCIQHVQYIQRWRWVFISPLDV